ncbi:MAG TPA: outer membrane lipoprotein chaperone LolA [Gammaproteobacteria bacterium]|nr:outer membrane lipoprotein chaperone LolA [Gammaproteobacteria bacterium]
MDFVKFWPRRHQAITRAFVLFAGCVAPVVPALSQDDASGDQGAGLELVERFVSDVEDLTAGFQQNVYDADGSLLHDLSGAGQFLLLRPDRFAWYYETPYEYQVIADGESLWTYDVDVEQITVSPLSDIAESPAMLLSGEGSVSENFSVRDVASIDGREWIELVPKTEDSEFVSARIAFRDGLPEALELVDGLSQVTRIEFSDIEINSGLRRREFDFDPPRGVDVIGGED